MRNEIWVSFNYGGWSLVFSKYYELPFTPFFGLGIIINNKKEYIIKLENDNYCSTDISWNIEKQQFDINVRNIWRHPVTNDTIDYELEIFSDWKRHDNTNIQDFKELMFSHYEKDNI
jgi:hypothetical protein